MSFFQRLFRPNKPDNKVSEAEVASVTEPASEVASGDDMPPAALAREITGGVTRPLPPEPMPIYDTQPGSNILFGQSSDQGMVRNNNQDAALSLLFTGASVDMHPPFALFIIADGMGGHSFGEKAAAIATRTIASEVINQIYLPLIKNADNGDAEQPTIAEILMQAFKKANEQIIKSVKDGGTTATALVMVGNLAHFAHVGDSRAYLINQRGIEQITRDHSLVQRLIELNQLTLDEAKEHSQRNVLYRALGQSVDLEVDVQTRRMPPASNILLCSDGLWGWVEEHNIQKTIQETHDPQEACNKLIAQANANGGPDNITAILLKMPSPVA
jgi:protein phosphatase